MNSNDLNRGTLWKKSPLFSINLNSAPSVNTVQDCGAANPGNSIVERLEFGWVDVTDV